MTVRLSPFFACTMLFLLVAVPAVRAQDDTAIDYLPLAVDNAWTFYSLVESPTGSIDTTVYDPYVITEEIVVADTVYYRYPLFFADTDTVRTDADGRIYGRVRDQDVLLFDVALPDSATYTYASPAYSDTFVVTVRRDQTIDVHGGRFLHALTFSFDIPQAVDDTRRFAFAPGVGLLQAVGGMGEFVSLYEAVVEGSVVTSMATNPQPESVALEAYPNPTRAHTIFRFVPSHPGRVRLAIYDLLGREVALLVDTCVGIGPQRVVWSADGLPAGTYFVRFSAAGQTQTVPLVHLP